MTILILGGTGEARSLAGTLMAAGVPIVSSLAGRVADPALPAGPVRVGGFGGIDGLVAYLRETPVSGVIDATHPFAAQISGHAAAAAQRTGVPLVRLERPGWRDHPDAGQWTWVADAEAARAATQAQRPFLTTGRQSLRTFLNWSDRAVLARVVDPPDFQLPRSWTLIRSRGPYDYVSERDLMGARGVDALLTKDSGGALTAAKLDAARDLSIRVIVLSRPPGPAGVPQVATVAEVLEVVRQPPWRER